MGEADKITILKQRLVKSKQFLDKTLGFESGEIQRAAAIQAFEMCFELTWKLLKLKLNDEGILTDSPREVIRKSAKLGFINDAEKWLTYLKFRNLTVHTYNEELAEQTYSEITKNFDSDLQNLLDKA